VSRDCSEEDLGAKDCSIHFAALESKQCIDSVSEKLQKQFLIK